MHRHTFALRAPSLVVFAVSAVALATLAACGDDKAAAPDTAGDTDEVGNDVVFPETVDTAVDTEPDREIVPGGFGAACVENTDCLDGYCVEGPEGFICTKGCESSCPDGYDCRGVQSGSADPVFLCLPRVAKVCVPCKADYQCTGGACLAIGGENMCATACTDDSSCPNGYGCLADAAHGASYCQPKSGNCDCTPDFADAVRTCLNANDVGTCYGVETCNPDVGWSGCTAAIATDEICDGRDNDCNALVDDGLEQNTPCENETPGVGVCSGVRVCIGTQGYVCTAEVPAPEACDFRDNDCDGETDNVPGRGEACVNTTAAGSCPGVNICQDGGLVCLGRTPSDEACNYEDDDCDGVTDNGYDGLYESCSSGLGVCRRFGTILCNAGGTAAECNAVPGASGAELCDGADNDCDGESDEDFAGVGEVCSDGVGVCRGFGTRACTADGTGTECKVVTGAGGAETCDLLDNDCDGSTDEDFKNAQGTKYVTNRTCGNCFTNCEAIFDKPNANGVCDATPAQPICKMACDAGYYDLNGVTDDGCEFFLDTTAIYVSESDPDADDSGTCGAGPTKTGANRKPCRTITAGLLRATTQNKLKVLVAGGAYTEPIQLKDGISLYGGYNPVDWHRDIGANLTAIFSLGQGDHRRTIIADAINQKVTVFDGFTVYGAVASDLSENTYAIWIRNSNGRLQITNNVIWPATGGPGLDGPSGVDGASGTDGSIGADVKETNTSPTFCFGTCTGSNPGGAGGVNSSCNINTAGGAGGSGRCPDFVEGANNFCSDTAYYAPVQTNNTGGVTGPGPNAGAGGTGGCDQQQGPSCVCSLPGAITNCPNGQFGAAGENGDNGDAGNAGVASTDTDGDVVNGEWAGFAGGNATAGEHGGGGGGGGAGGGVESASACNGSPNFDGGNDFGGGGGGGGSGGGGGTAGNGGQPGGGSFGIFIVFTLDFGVNLPAIADNDIHTGFGGRGGDGGNGGSAGLGGLGAKGGDAAPDSSSWCAKPGAPGGRGGDGGPGGGGAGGAGGVAYGLYAYGDALAEWKTNNTFFNDGAGGSGGNGGGTGPGGKPGQNGVSGKVANHNIP